MTAKELFKMLNYRYEKIDNSYNNCKDVILYTNTIQDLTIQFNLMSKNVVFNAKNHMQNDDRIIVFMTKEIINAINMQINELGWNND